MSGSFSEFLFTSRARPIVRNPGAAEVNQTTAHALSRAALRVPQSQFFDFVEVDFNLKTASVRVDGLPGIKRQISTQQIPEREGEPRDGNNDHAGGQCAVGPHATQ